MNRERPGVLRLRDGKLGLEGTSKKGNAFPVLQFRPAHLLGRLAQAPHAELDGREVRYATHVDGNYADAVWPADEQRPAAVAPTARPTTSPGTSQPPQARTAAAWKPSGPTDFHNPYNFVPAPPRDVADADLGDGAGPGHGRYLPDRWSGTVHVRLTAVTPLLLPDAAKAEEAANGHQTHPLRIDEEGRPVIAPTSLKGVLRSAFEAVTNSRFGVFVDHDDRLAYRQTTRAGLEMVPARVSDDGEHVELLPGTNRPRAGALARRDVQHAAWLPAYPDHRALPYESGGMPDHGDEVVALVRRARHRREFEYWEVRRLARAGTDAAEALRAAAPDQVERIVRGWVCRTGRNIGNKHDERVFFDGGAGTALRLTDELRRQWKNVVNDYRAAHQKKDIWHRRGAQNQPGAYLGREPGKTAWSRHLYEDDAKSLGGGSLCYARLTDHGGSLDVESLFPVMIGRELYPASPAELLHESLHPAGRPDSLSPADRVFGWTAPSGEGSYRGHVRVHDVRLDAGQEPADVVQDFGREGLPLAILSSPKPQQARFYAAADQHGTPLPPGQRGRQGYRHGEGLRGRKVYLHQAGLPEGHWDGALRKDTQRAVDGRHPEYRRPREPGGKEQRDDQNRSVTGWVRPGAMFGATIEVTNLSDVELGALIWLLDLPDGAHHRLGGGKPLGFGSVRVSLDTERTHLLRGTSIAESYRALEDPAERPSEDASQAVHAFQSAVERVSGVSRFEDAPWVAAFLAAACGPAGNEPIHYPRARQTRGTGPVPPHPEGKAYEWFVENDRIGRDEGPAVALPPLTSGAGLPMLERRH